jgi:hypothetical protein
MAVVAEKVRSFKDGIASNGAASSEPMRSLHRYLWNRSSLYANGEAGWRPRLIPSPETNT